jgi:hypothetical protein
VRTNTNTIALLRKFTNAIAITYLLILYAPYTFDDIMILRKPQKIIYMTLAFHLMHDILRLIMSQKHDSGSDKGKVQETDLYEVD